MNPNQKDPAESEDSLCNGDLVSGLILRVKPKMCVCTRSLMERCGVCDPKEEGLPTIDSDLDVRILEFPYDKES